MADYLLDTSVLIDYLRGDARTIEFLKNQNNPTISIITAAEIYQGVRNKTELDALIEFINHIQVIPIDEAISQYALKLMQIYTLSHHLLILDALIAATAIQFNLILITGNSKHFKMIKGLNVKKW